MSNYYEETIPPETNIDKYLQYYFDESLLLFDKLNIIVKKGQPFQKQALLSKLNLYQSNSSLFKSLLQYIINDIKTWDKETIQFFPKSIHTLLTQPRDILLSSIDNELFNMILNHIVTSISSTDEDISQNYIFHFDQIVFFYSNNNNNFPYIINDEIYDDIISLGKFGQTVLNRKLSCYLCCAIIRILKKANNENVQKLYSRICFLFCDSDKEIETQLSKELEFLIPIFQQNIFENSDVLQAIYSFINHDSYHIIQSTTIISLLKNLMFIQKIELAEKIVEKITEIFEDNYEQKYKNQIFNELINALFTNYKLINSDVIKLIFKDYIIPKFIMKNKKESIIIENFDKIYFIFNDMNNELEIWNNNNNVNNTEENTENNFNNINFDDLFIYLYSVHFNNNNYSIHDAQTEKENNSKNIFYISLMKIIPLLPNLKTSKNIYDKINHLFNKDNIIFALKCYSEKIKYIEKNGQKKMENNLLYLLMTFLLKKNYEIFKQNNNQVNGKPLSPIKKEQTTNNNPNPTNDNNYYIKLFNNIINNILLTFKEKSILFTNNNHLLLCDFFQRISKKIFKYLKPTIPNPQNGNNTNLFLGTNNTKIKSIDKIYEDIFSSYLIKLVENQKLGNYIKNEIIQVFPYLILFSKNRLIYFKYINENIINSHTYFNRRYSIPFLNKCFQIYSFKMINKIGIIDIVLNLVNDTNNAISANVINLIYIYNKKIILNSNFTFQDICKNLSKINKLNKDNKTVSIQNFDIEKNRYIKDILNLNLINSNNLDRKVQENNEDTKNNTECDFWQKNENKLIMREIEIFGKNSNYGFDFKGFMGVHNFPNHSQSPEINAIKRKSNYLNNLVNSKELLNLKVKDKANKRGLIKDKYSASSIIINNHNNLHNFNYNSKEKLNSKTILPKIRQNNRNNGLSNKAKFNNQKNINNFKMKQENQKLYETNQKSSMNNNSMVIINDKSSPIKTHYGLLPFSQNIKTNKAVKVRNSVPSVYPDLFSNNNNNNNNSNGNNDNNINDENKIKNTKIPIENNNKYKIEMNQSNGKSKEISNYSINKTKNNIYYINPNLRNSKTLNLRRDNSLKDTFGRYSKIFMKINGDNDKFNLTNISFKDLK